MALRLILLRHAKSSWKTDAADHDRPLNKRGKRDAPRIGEAIAARQWFPDVALVSTAVRARDTYARMASHFPETPVSHHRDLYHADLDEIVSLLRPLPDAVRCCMVVGHNPGWEDALSQLVGGPMEMTTGNAALLEREGDWATVPFDGGWRLVELIRPRQLPDD